MQQGESRKLATGAQDSPPALLFRWLILLRLCRRRQVSPLLPHACVPMAIELCQVDWDACIEPLIMLISSI